MSDLTFATLEEIMDELARRFDHVIMVACKDNPKRIKDELVYAMHRGSSFAGIGLADHFKRQHEKLTVPADEKGNEVG